MQKGHIVLMAAALLLLGAGCNQGAPASNDTNSSTPTTTSTPATGDLKITVKQTASNTVEFSWNQTTSGTWRMLNSSKPNPEHPEGNAFWFEVVGSRQSAEWGGIPNGTRHFRLCEFKDKECVRYSDDLEVKIK